MSSHSPPRAVLPLPVVFGVFVASGFAALVYQVAWQRVLLAVYGVNNESVTIVVSAFMLGLGLGSFVGGALSRNPRRPVLVYFGAIELGIGLFGITSLRLFRWLGWLTAGAGPKVAFACSFGLLLVPTMLMGATLPLLVAYLVRASGNVGRSVGVLYFVNTLGSAVAAVLAAVWLLGALGLQGTVSLAAAVNLTAGLIILVAAWRKGASGRADATSSLDA